ncbi:MAG: Gfo/Idh/MocA family oxidoreductase [Proteobacteria bacterium]|nr:Gfo/Idh/MocA family oxidoreductase [Pseudomonadota bacterium]
MKPVRIIVIGAGDRGSTYASYALAHPDLAQVVGVAEPREEHRRQMAEGHNIPEENVTADWRELADRPKFADAVFVTTPDRLHQEPAIAFADLGYAILLEKPMAPNEEDCVRISEAIAANGVLCAVCHVMRYTPYTQALKSLLDSGIIGEIVNIQQLEPVGYWHQAHSFVRGNWRNESESSFMLLAKSCHDIDWLRYLMGKRCLSVSSFGSLKHFRKEEKPATAGDRCLDCDYEPDCPYSAQKIYLNPVKQGESGWPYTILTADVNEENVKRALREGPYGRCVYECDNDVVDHQVVVMQFEGGATASFTMTAFTKGGDRITRIFGTRGEIYGDGTKLEHYDFLTDVTTIHEIDIGDASGHGGGDERTVESFIAAVANNDPSLILSDPEETLESHLIVFAAERARRENRVVNLLS